jgi:hypothetical protein
MKIPIIKGLCLAFILYSCATHKPKNMGEARGGPADSAPMANETSGVSRKGEMIRRDSARSLICNWQRRYDLGYDDQNDNTRGVLAGKERLLELLNAENVEGLRFYFVLNKKSDGTFYRDLIAIPVNADNQDMVPIFSATLDSLQKADVLDGMAGCPYECEEPSTFFDCP